MVLGAFVNVIDDLTWGTLVFGGNRQKSFLKGELIILPRDALRRRVFLQALGMWKEIDVGTIEQLIVKDGTMAVVVRICQ